MGVLNSLPRNHVFLFNEKLHKMQAHSMKYNLIFSGIPESEDRQVENCETTIKNFTNNDLGVEGDVEFQNVHRLRQRVDRKPRNIITKFTKYTDHEKVRTAAFEKLRGRKDFVVFQQYPAEISARRKELIPQMKALKREGRQGVRLVMDTLYVGNHLVNQHPIHRIKILLDSESSFE